MTPNDVAGNGVGSLFLRDLIASTPEVNVSVVRVPRFLIEFGGRRYRRIRRLPGLLLSRSGWLQALRLKAFRWVRLPQMAQRVVRRANELGSDCIWVTASSPEVIWIADRLSALGMDLRVTVWDSPEYILGNLRLPMSERRRVLSSFENVLRKAKAATVATMNMQRDYQERFGIRSEIVRHGIQLEISRDTSPPHSDVRIAFAGSLYAKAEWNCFLQALSSVNWVINGRKVELYFIGRFPLTGAMRPGEVTVLGEMPFEQAMAKLATMDIGYVPYWFSRNREIEARTSFPGKVSAYGVAGLAIFHHGPPYTEITEFLRAYPFGVACGTLESEGIVRHLSRLVASMDSDEFRSARERAVCSELSASAMASRFRRFLAVG